MAGLIVEILFMLLYIFTFLMLCNGQKMSECKMHWLKVTNQQLSTSRNNCGNLF